MLNMCVNLLDFQQISYRPFRLSASLPAIELTRWRLELSWNLPTELGMRKQETMQIRIIIDSGGECLLRPASLFTYQ